MEPLSNPTTDEGQEYLTVLINEMKGDENTPWTPHWVREQDCNLKHRERRRKKGNMRRFGSWIKYPAHGGSGQPHSARRFSAGGRKFRLTAITLRARVAPLQVSFSENSYQRAFLLLQLSLYLSPLQSWVNKRNVRKSLDNYYPRVRIMGVWGVWPPN